MNNPDPHKSMQCMGKQQDNKAQTLAILLASVDPEAEAACSVTDPRAENSQARDLLKASFLRLLGFSVHDAPATLTQAVNTHSLHVFLPSNTKKKKSLIYSPSSTAEVTPTTRTQPSLSLRNTHARLEAPGFSNRKPKVCCHGDRELKGA
jgi:hypothetical protein